MNNQEESKRLYKAIGEADESLLERAAQHQKRKVYRLVKWSAAAAACACVIAAGSFSLNVKNTAPEHQAIISDYPGNGLSVMYAAPSDGQIQYENDVQEALKDSTNQDAVFFVELTLFRDEAPVNIDTEDVSGEIKRLKDSGYQVGFAKKWTYEGDLEKVDVTYLAGFFSKDELDNFNAGSDYGYVFSFAKNGDGSVVSSEQELAYEIEDFSK